MPVTASHPSPARRRPDGGPPLPLALTGAVLVVFAAIVAFAVTGSSALRALAFAVLALVTVGVIVFLARLLMQTRDAEQAAESDAEAVVAVGAGVPEQRLRAAVTVSLRDLHALQRGIARFAAGAGRRLAGVVDDEEPARRIARLFDEQRTQAAEQEGALMRRLEELGRRHGRAVDGELLVAEWLYERLLSHSVIANARHAYGLAQLTAASAALLERLAAASGDEQTRALAASIRRRAEMQAVTWSGAWDAVLDTFAAQHAGDGTAAIDELLDEAVGMEQMRASMLSVAADHGNEAGVAPGAEEAGLERVLDALGREATEADAHLHAVRRRVRERGHRSSRLHNWESFAAARATGLSEHVRGYKLVRDVRDVVASDQLEAATFDLLELAARRAADEATADLARRLGAEAADGSVRARGELDSALQIALLAE